jgi:peptidase E
MTQIIYGIGGGNMRDDKMQIHYQRILELSKEQFGRDEPRVAILPTAHLNGTNEVMGRGFIDYIGEVFEVLGCATRYIWIGDLLPDQKPTSNGEVSEILDESDAVFVLGGDTQYLLEVVRERELVPVFEKVLAEGRVMSGTSAGLIWLAECSMSDSESFHKDNWDYIMLQGIGVLPLAVNVHDNGSVPNGIIDKRSRKEQFEERFRKLGSIPGLAVDEFVGIEVIDGICKVRSTVESIGVEVLANGEDAVIRKRVRPGDELDIKDQAGLRSFALSGI